MPLDSAMGPRSNRLDDTVTLPVFRKSAARRCLLLAVCIAALPMAPRAQSVSGTTSAGIFYESSGMGAEAIVLIHGFSLDRRIWQPQMTTLEQRFRVVRYDLRGHGKSEGPTGPFAPYEDLRSVLDALGIARATLVGHSAGAEVATDFALAYPDRVARLILAGPGLSGFTISPPLTWVAPVFQAAGAGDVDRAITLWIDTPIMRLHGDLAARPIVTNVVRDNARIWSYRSNPAQPLTPPAVKRLGEIGCPVLIVVGDRDLPHIQQITKVLAAGVPNSRTVIIPGAGHLVTIDAPQPFNVAVTEFLDIPRKATR